MAVQLDLRGRPMSNIRSACMLVVLLVASAAPAQQFTYDGAALPPQSVWTNGVAIADIDNDGDNDIVFANGSAYGGTGAAGSQPQHLFLNDGGAFTAAHANLGVANFNAMMVIAQDFDGDGDIDLAWASGSTGSPPRLLLNQGGLQGGTIGFFTDVTATNIPALPVQLRSFCIASGDVDDDGDLDLAVTDGGTVGGVASQVRLFLNDGLAGFSDVTALQLPVDLYNCQDVTLLDFDGDFDIDIALSGKGAAGKRSRLYLNDGSGQFTISTVMDAVGTGNTTEIDWSDLDGDTDLDAAVLSLAALSDGWARNDGTGVPLVTTLFVGPNSSEDNEVALLDYDSDGNVDVLVGSFATGGEQLFRNSGVAFNKVSGVIQVQSDTTLDVGVADLNGDDAYDFVTAQGQSGNFTNKVYVNNGLPDTLAPGLLSADAPAIATPSTVFHARVLDAISDDGVVNITLTYDWKRSDDTTGETGVAAFHMGSGLFRMPVPTTAATTWVCLHFRASDSSGNVSVFGPLWAGALLNPCPCDDQVAVLDAGGDVILPPGAEEVTDEIIDLDMGLVEDLYPDADTSLDLWYGDYPCDESIGEEPPPVEATDADLDAELAAAGITGVTAAEMIAQLAIWEDQIATVALAEPDVLSSPTVPPATGPYTPPLVPHATVPGDCYVLGGRDLVFVHGLQVDHIMDKITGDTGANTPWMVPTSFPGSTENPKFYDEDGYYKEIAVDIWEAHIQRFLRDKGIKNRYLIVPYSCAERLEVAAQTVLTMIGDAMRQNIGVIDPAIPHQTADPPAPFDFGTPSFVIISHSTGGPVVDVAMSVAASNPNLQAAFIPQHCKAHIALHGALGGSRLATAAVAVSGFIGVVSITQFPWLCPLISATIAFLTETVQPCPIGFVAIAQSVLVDLVPLVMQLKWGDEIDSTPVRTVTVIGGHPSFVSPFKSLLLPGFDDGVTNINSQAGNPNSTLFWPSGFIPDPPALLGWAKLYDRGVAQTGPNRAIFEFIEQVVDPKLQPAGLQLPILVSGGATPFVSPTGMLQPVGDTLASAFGGVYSTLNRYGNHFSFLQSASHHFGPNGSFGGFNGDDYKDTFPYFLAGPFETNWEETRVLTDERIYDEYEMVYDGDNEPLLTEGIEPKLREVVRGRLIQFKLFGKKYKWWVWKRRYHLLAGAQTLTEMDYVYRYLLTNPGVIAPCDPDWVDLGRSLPGVFGSPLLEGTGALVAGNLVALDLSNAAPHAPCLLFASVQSVTVPFKGGVLCAFPPIAQITLFTNGAGNIHLPFAWPANIPAGISIYAQMVILDSVAIQGVAISNLVEGITQ